MYRLVIDLHGLELLFYNNSAKYQYFKSMLSKSVNNNTTNTTTNNNNNDIEIPISVTEYTPSLLIKLFPVIGIIIHTGCIYIGNPYLPTLLLLQTKKAVIVYSHTNALHPQFDYYRQLINIQLSSFSMKFTVNSSYNIAMTNLNNENNKKSQFVVNLFYNNKF